jgi:very-short-patch-repair endonuclease
VTVSKILTVVSDQKLHQGASSDLFVFARQNRKTMTKAESILWERLRNRKIRGLKFRRQHPISKFIADFFCLERNLVIEVDGGYHLCSDQKKIDTEKTRELEKLGIKIIRFTNQQVIEDPEFVLAEIEKTLDQVGI